MSEPPLHPYAPPRDTFQPSPRLADRPSNSLRVGSWLLLAQSLVIALVWLMVPGRVWSALIQDLLIAALAVALLRFRHPLLPIATLALLVVHGMWPFFKPVTAHVAVIRAVGAVVTLLNVVPFAVLLVAHPTRWWRNAAIGLLGVEMFICSPAESRPSQAACAGTRTMPSLLPPHEAGPTP